MKPTNINYCSCEGNPALLAYYDDGRILGFEYVNDAWKQVHGADVVTKGVVIGKGSFEKRWPEIGLPSLPE